MSLQLHRIKKGTEEIVSYIRDSVIFEPNISHLSNKKIKNIVNQGFSYILKNQDAFIGFILSERMYKNYFELSTLFIEPKYRNQKLSYLLLDKVLEHRERHYFFFTFRNQIQKTMKDRYGFNEENIFIVPLLVRLKIILKRLHPKRMKDIVMKSSKVKPVFMFKQAI